MKSEILYCTIRRSLPFVLTLLALLGISHSAEAQGSVLHSFQSNGQDGTMPYAGLVSDALGNLYGDTSGGGLYGCGTVFELSPPLGGDWTETVLYNFKNDGQDGCFPIYGLVVDASGNFYGTTLSGGTWGVGTAFELSPQSGGIWTEAILHSFQIDGQDGMSPYAALIFDTSGNLFGTTGSGGKYGGGIVFELSQSSGIWSEAILYNFRTNGSDGFGPGGNIVFDKVGNLYGTTANGLGRTDGLGTVYRLSPLSGGHWVERILYAFNGVGKGGRLPSGGLIIDSSGNLYGTTLYGGSGNNCRAGSGGCGTVFALKHGKFGEFTLYSFKDHGGDGRNPYGGLVFDAAGNLYGTMTSGGTGGCPGGGCGTVFELAVKTGNHWSEKVLYSFKHNGGDGYFPQCNLLLDLAGNIYGTTLNGGSMGNYGTVFEVSPHQ